MWFAHPVRPPGPLLTPLCSWINIKASLFLGVAPSGALPCGLRHKCQNKALRREANTFAMWLFSVFTYVFAFFPAELLALS